MRHVSAHHSGTSDKIASLSDQGEHVVETLLTQTQELSGFTPSDASSAPFVAWNSQPQSINFNAAFDTALSTPSSETDDEQGSDGPDPDCAANNSGASLPETTQATSIQFELGAGSNAGPGAGAEINARGSSVPQDGSEQGSGQGAGGRAANVDAKAAAPGLNLNSQVGAPSESADDDPSDGDSGDTSTDDSGAADSGTADTGLDLSASLAGLETEIETAAQSDATETPPSDDAGSDGADPGGADDGGNDGALSGASAQLMQALSDIADTECGCDDDDADTGGQTGDSGTGDTGGGGADTTGGTDQDGGAASGGGLAASDLLGNAGFDLQSDAGGINLSASGDSDDDQSTDPDDGTDNGQDDGADAATGDGDTDGGFQGQSSIGAELDSALTHSMVTASFGASSSLSTEDLSALGATMDAGQSGTGDDASGGEADTTDPGGELGLDSLSHGDCGCSNPLDSLTHSI